MKKGLEIDLRASSRSASKPLFQFAEANSDGAAVRTAAWLGCALLSPFRCGETSGKRARFPAGKTAHPHGRNHPTMTAG
ncbi:MAG: hypothetical protein II343_07210, partial [Clostridia bacterium]|nr:hypothetical protein [Clostridia bacterium]